MTMLGIRPSRNQEKKIVETHALTAARMAGAPIPTDEIPCEEPDFRFETETGTLGIEVRELLLPPSSNFGIVPAAEETYHQEILQMAQEEYYRVENATPVRVVLYFASARGKRRDKQDMARTLAEFVRANVERAQPVVTFSGLQLPEGFGSMSIASELGNWWCGACWGVTLSDIRAQVAASIDAKNKLVPRYRANLPDRAEIWLLLYTTVAVSRSMPIPHGIEGWKFSFDFNRVFWFGCLENKVVELQSSEGGAAV